MHAPRRSHALSRKSTAAPPQSTRFGSPTTAVDAFTNDSSPQTSTSSPEPYRASSEANTRAGLSGMAKPNLLSSRPARSVEAALASSQRERPSPISPRTMWRAPAPRPIPMPGLLPSVTTVSTARTTRSTGAARPASKLSPVTARERGSVSPSAADAVESDVDGYGEEYVRLVFDDSRSTSVSEETGLMPHVRLTLEKHHQQQQQEQQDLPPSTPTRSAVHTPRLPPVSTHSHLRSPSPSPVLSSSPRTAATTHTITDAQATAVLAQMPDHNSLADPHTTSKSHLSSAATAAAASPPSASVKKVGAGPLYSNDTSAVHTTAPTQPPQPEAWWSTLDGTLSTYNSPHGTTHLHDIAGGRAGAGAAYHIPPPVPTLAAPAQNLNDTLGRADRAAMVLSMSPSSRIGLEVAQPAQDFGLAEPTARTADSSVPTTGVNDAAATDPAAAAVAALAARLSRAAGRGNANGSSNIINNNINNNLNGLAELTTSTLVHQNTIQELRDTLRMTEADALLDLQQQPHFLLHGAPNFATSPSDSTFSLDRDASPNTSGQQRGRKTGLTDPQVQLPRQVPLVSIVQPSQLRSAQKEPDAFATPGFGGPGTKRTRDALARLYALPGTTALKNTGVAGGSEVARSGAATALSSALPRKLYFLSRPGPSISAPAPAISTDSETRAMPWQCEALTRATVERCFGPPEAAHAAPPRRARRHKPRQQEPQVPRPYTDQHAAPTHQPSVQALRGPRTSSRAAQKPITPSATPAILELASPASSVSSAVFSSASLTASIFVREVGDGAALRQSYMTMMAGEAEKVGEITEKTETKGRPQLQQGTAATTTAAAAAAEAAGQYRREQQRLYASHLASTSRALAGVDKDARDALEPHLDVDFLFSDIKPKPRDYTLSDRAKPISEVNGVGGGARTPALGQTTGAKGKSAAMTTRGGVDAASGASAPVDALQAAMQARADLLRRHVQVSPAWERLLYKVRQWCDRTQVMVQLETGECVEQTGARPPQLLRVPTHPTLDAASEAPSDVPQNSVDAAAEALPHSPLRAHYVYVDDPATAHAVLMQHVAQEAADVQRRNALEQCRQRQQQWETTVHESTLIAPDAFAADAAGSPLLPDESVYSHRTSSASSRSGSVFSHGGHATAGCPGSPLQSLQWSSRRSTAATPSTWAKVSGASDGVCASAAAAAAATAAAMGSLSFESNTVEFNKMGTAANAAYTSDARPPGTGAGAPSPFVIDKSFAALGDGPLEPDGAAPDAFSAFTNAQDAARVSAAPFQPSGGRGLTSQHAALCSKLQTWGDPVEDEVTYHDEDEGESVDLASQRKGDGTVGPLVVWKRESTHVPGVAIRETDPHIPFSPINPSADRFSVVSVNSGARAHALTSMSRIASFRCSGVEKDLFAFVLTCGSSSRTSSSAANSGLFSLLSLAGRREGHAASVAGMDSSVQAAQQALRAVQSILRDGFGVSTLSKLESFDFPSETATSQELSACLSASEAKSQSALLSATASLPWEALVSTILDGSSVSDYPFLKHLHALLWAYEAWRQKEESERSAAAAATATGASTEGGRRRPHGGVTILPTTAALIAEQPPLVLPLTVQVTHPVSANPSQAKRRSFHDGGGEGSGEESVSLSIDAADLFCGLASAPTLVLWLLDAHHSSPTSTWMEIVDAMPTRQQQEWHSVVAACVARAAQQATSHATANSPSAAAAGEAAAPVMQPSLSNEQRNSVMAAASLTAFVCDMPAAVSAIVWRQRVFHSLLKRSLANMEADTPLFDGAATTAAGATTNTTTTAATGSTSSTSRRASTVSTSQEDLPHSFPMIGSTPYLPDEEGRVNYPLDMRNGYLYSSLAREEVKNRVVPQLRETRRQFAEAVRTARAAAATRHDGARLFSPLNGTSASSLSFALQQRVHLQRLVQMEQRFLYLLSTLWHQETSIRAFNDHVGPFNDFTRAEQRRWGPLYRSSLTVAYCVCEELAEKKMENLPPTLLPFVSVVAAFMGCRGGHRELRTKLRAVMLDLEERAKKVQVHVESLVWQGRRSEVLAEAVAAAAVAPRRAGAVVSVLATESDVNGVPLTTVALPAVQLRNSLPLPPSEE